MSISTQESLDSSSETQRWPPGRPSPVAGERYGQFADANRRYLERMLKQTHVSAAKRGLPTGQSTLRRTSGKTLRLPCGLLRYVRHRGRTNAWMPLSHLVRLWHPVRGANTRHSARVLKHRSVPSVCGFGLNRRQRRSIQMRPPMRSIDDSEFSFEFMPPPVEPNLP